MEKLKIKIHLTFVIFACVLIYFGKSVLFFNYCLVMFLHEFAHSYVAKKLGYNIKNIKLIPFGICLDMNSSNLLPRDEIKIALAGPITNFILMLFTMSLWWVFPSSYNYTNFFCYANFITGIFNLIPAFPLDGGRVLLSILKQNMQVKIAIKFCKVINIIIILCLGVMFVTSCFFSVNLTYILVILCLISGVIDNNKMQKYSLINYGVLKKMGKVLKQKGIVVSMEVSMYKLCRYIDNFSYLSVCVLDNNKNIIATITEKQFLDLLEKYGASAKLGDVLNKNVY